MQQQTNDKRTASQRIEDLENGLMGIYRTADQMARDLMTVKEAIKLLGNKLDAVVKASRSGQTLTDEAISNIMIQNNVEELREKVTKLVADGVLGASETIELNSFVVGKEIDEKGTVHNPRLQFVVSTLQEELKGKFLGAKVGSVLDFEEGKLKFEVMEIYQLQAPKTPEEMAQEEASLEAKADQTGAEAASGEQEEAKTESETQS